MGKSDFMRWKMGLKAVSGPCVYMVVLLPVGTFLYLLSIECRFMGLRLLLETGSKMSLYVAKFSTEFFGKRLYFTLSSNDCILCFSWPLCPSPSVCLSLPHTYTSPERSHTVVYR